MTQCIACLSPGPTTLAPPELTHTPTKNPAIVESARKQHDLTPTLVESDASSDLSKQNWRPAVAARDWKYLVLHHTATDHDSVATIDRVHRQRKDKQGQPWVGIGYHFVIGNGHGMEDGQIEPTFRWQKQLAGAHAGVGRYNDAGIGICLVGNFEEQQPTKKQFAAVNELVSSLRTQFEISPTSIVGHNQVKATECPGKHLSVTAIVERSTAQTAN
jgi:N-acetyl-anhydromuramyl-L-alanine amidase AmpD